ncbi:uncharacterized protein LOC8055340 isoform X2 [Sorghum bicolor]|uniref:uncharacterized protein LOC8055340 isoform X2 n=1 Tax=Sorghum bicolor TaxID=4558 RepID=UPI000B425244|nr:uncharacterized protein LOC8055340 isoform X2 [Sorghum bicolor]|eukprot:XP_021314377.1 uncharacterized protein LOC8055340 isoform X2 [Sorghum bicolor]
MESKEEAMMMVAAPAAGAGEAKNGPPVAVDKAGAAPADRDAAVLAKVEMDRKLSMIKAWEESEKSKAQNNAGPRRRCCRPSWRGRRRRRRQWKRSCEPERGEAGEEEGGVRREDEEPSGRHPQGRGREARVGGGDATRGHPQVRGHGGLHPSIHTYSYYYIYCFRPSKIFGYCFLVCSAG